MPVPRVTKSPGIEQIPGRLQAIWRESEDCGDSSDKVADRMGRRLIGRESG